MSVYGGALHFEKLWYVIDTKDYLRVFIKNGQMLLLLLPFSF